MTAVFKASILILIWLLNIGIITSMIDRAKRNKQEKEFNKQMIAQMKNAIKRGEDDDIKRDDK